jgi:hypothetical protein
MSTNKKMEERIRHEVTRTPKDRGQVRTKKKQRTGAASTRGREQRLENRELEPLGPGFLGRLKNVKPKRNDPPSSKGSSYF